MNFKPIFTDFEKRYGTPCDRSYFIGKPVIFMQSADTVIGTAVSSGGFLTVSERDDGRLLIQFSHSAEMLNRNIDELAVHSNEHTFSLLLKMQKFGIKLRGVQLLFSNISPLIMSEDLMLLTAAGALCDSPPPPHELLAHFNNFEQNLIAAAARRDTAVLLQGGTPSYLPLPDSLIKVVLCYPPANNISDEISGTAASGAIGGRSQGQVEIYTPITQKRAVVPNTSSQIDEAIFALHNNSVADFGKILTRHGDEVLRKKGAPKKARDLYQTARNFGDAYGCGFLSDGGIFAIVKNNKVDTFMHNLRAEYECSIGGKPQFFVTRSEDSAIYSTPSPSN